MSAAETWRNEPELHETPDGRISPLWNVNGTIYDAVIADPWFGKKPRDETIFGRKHVPVSMLLAFVREPENIDDINLFESYEDTMLLKNLHALAYTYNGAV